MAPILSWQLAPDRGGVRIPEAVRARTDDRLRRCAREEFAGRFTRLDVRFHAQFCYVDAYTEPEPTGPTRPPSGGPGPRDARSGGTRSSPIHLCRLRYFGDEERWGFAFYTWSNERYEVSVFPSGAFLGPPEDAFRVAAGVYLR